MTRRPRCLPLRASFFRSLLHQASLSVLACVLNVSSGRMTLAHPSTRSRCNTDDDQARELHVSSRLPMTARHGLLGRKEWPPSHLESADVVMAPLGMLKKPTWGCTLTHESIIKRNRDKGGEAADGLCNTSDPFVRRHS
jgi:hypothetical protein